MEGQKFSLQEHLRERMKLAIHASHRGEVNKRQRADITGKNSIPVNGSFIFDDLACQLAVENLISLGIALSNEGISGFKVKEILQKLNSILGLDVLALYGLDHYEHLQMIFRMGDIGGDGNQRHLPNSVGSPDGFVGSLWAKRNAIFVGDLGGGSGSIRSFIGLPLFVEDKFMGAMVFLSSYPRRFPALYKTMLFKMASLFAEYFSILQNNGSDAEQPVKSSNQNSALHENAREAIHDLNNVFAAILGKAEMLKVSIDNNQLKEGFNLIENRVILGAAILRRFQESLAAEPHCAQTIKTDADSINALQPADNRHCEELESKMEIRSESPHSSKCKTISIDVSDPTEHERICRILRQIGYSASPKSIVGTESEDNVHPFRCSIIGHNVYLAHSSQIDKLLQDHFRSIIIIGPEEERQRISESLPESALFNYVVSPYRSHQLLLALENLEK